MKNFIPLILAVLFIGAGCVFQEESPAVNVEEPVIQQSMNVNGVLEAFDEASRTAEVRTATGLTEEVAWPADAPSAAGRLGAMVTARGTRNASTLVIAAEDVEFPESQNLMVVSPSQGDTVTSPLVVTGFGRAFEQTFNWRIRDAAGSVVDSGYAMTDARDIGWFGPFSFEIFLPALTDVHFTLDVLSYSAKDGSEQDLVSVPLTLLSTKTTELNVFFSNASMGSARDCEKTFPLPRVVAQTSAVGRASLNELLKGPTTEEKARGYSTQIPPGASLLSLVISDRTAKADFSSGLNAAGSCRVGAIRTQIEQTLMQFDTVDTVTISVNGDAATALQP